MEFHTCFSLVLICFIGFVHVSQAYTEIHVGGDEGWTVMDYTHWSQGIVFHVNDFLFFKYNAGSDSVLVVNKEDYYNCNKENPIRNMDSGRSLFMLDTTGPFYFISGTNGKCEQGQGLVIVVSDGKSGTQAPPPSESPNGQPGTHAPTHPAPSAGEPWALASAPSAGQRVVATPSVFLVMVVTFLFSVGYGMEA